MTTTQTGSALERAALIERAHRVISTPERNSLRDARAQRRHALSGYKNALDQMRPQHYGAVKAYAAALSAEAAANRAEANELRDLLAAILRAGGER
ncbi:hypothetical protein ACPCHV_02385 [Microbacterium sp. NPDC088796]